MKLIIIQTNIVLLLIFTVMSGCENGQQEDSLELFGTWKFFAFGDSDGSIRTAQPDDCEKCYVITFKEDSTMVGKSVINILGKGFILSGSQLSFPWGVLATDVLEEGDPHIFTEALENVTSFQIEKFQLKLYYSDNKFLLFQPMTPNQSK
jgi:hypothetical protein